MGIRNLRKQFLSSAAVIVTLKGSGYEMAEYDWVGIAISTDPTVTSFEEAMHAQRLARATPVELLRSFLELDSR